MPKSKDSMPAPKAIHPFPLLPFRRITIALTVASFLIPGARVRSTDKKAPSTWKPEISSMGAIARGDVPRPSPIEYNGLRAPFASPPRSPLGAQGNDVLVHSSMAPDFQSETSIAVNGNFVVAGYNDVRGFGLTDPSVSGYSYSSDGGVTWTDGGQLPTAGGDQVFGDPDIKTWTDPGNGNVWFFYSSIYVTPSGSNSLCINVSSDGGATWSTPREITTSTNASDFSDKEFMDVDPETGRIFVSWTNFGASTTMRITYSDDMGMTWNGPTVFSAAGQGSVPRADPKSNNVYMVWRASSSLQFVSSTDNGLTWSTVKTAATGLVDPMNPYGSDRIGGFPSMAVSPVNGDIYIVYNSRNLAPDFGDTYFTRSTDGGASFSAPVTINANPGSDRVQFYSWVTVDDVSGTISAVWYDQSAGTGTSDLTDVYHTHSTDGGITWSCPAPLTDAPFHAEYGNTTSQPNIGDYIQTVARGGNLYTLFAKTDSSSYLTYAPDTYVDVSPVSGAAAPVAFSGVSFVDMGCNPPNGFIETGETVQLTTTIVNRASACNSITGIVGTLSSLTPGITVTSASQSFGPLGGAPGTTTNLTPFVIQVDNAFPCGAHIDLLLSLTTSQGPASIPIQLASGVPQSTTLLTESFDGATAPTLPPGWTTSVQTGATNPWTTSTTFASSGTNSAFCADIGMTSNNRLTSPSIAVPLDCSLLDVTFDVTHNIELDTERKAWDGALLKVEINDGVNTTVKLAGSFASLFEPFYPWQMNRQQTSTQPLQDLACWSSNVTPTFNSVHLQFPGLAGTTVRLFWEMGTDGSVGTSSGMFVDNVAVASIAKTCTCTGIPVVRVNPSPVTFASAPGNVTSCDTVYVVNDGTDTLSIAGISGCGTAPFSIDSTMTAHTVAPMDSTPLVICVTPTVNGADSCTVTITSNASNSPTVIPVMLQVVTAIAGGRPTVPFAITAIVPNPFNPTTAVRFTLPKRMAVTVEVWSVNGARVRVLSRHRVFAAGANRLKWDGRNATGATVASGVYFIRIKTRLGEKVARAVLLK